jgi:hypothetical protein
MIFLSPGHHPSAPGAVFQGFAEHDEAVRWVEEIYKNLPPDTALKVPPLVLQQKVDFINKRNIIGRSIAIEVHFNSAKKWNDIDHDGVVDDGEETNVGRGSETLYLPGSVKGQILANSVQAAVSQVFTPSRGVKEGYYQANPAKGPDYFLAKTICPAVIVEPEFIQFKKEIQEGRAMACALIAKALQQFNY